MALEFPLPPAAKDPDTLEPWARNECLEPGRSPRVVTITVVDAHDQPIVVPPGEAALVPGTVSWVLADAATNRWTFTWNLSGGSTMHVSEVPNASLGTYLLRLRFWFDDRPDDQPPSADRTLAIRVAQT